MPRLLHTPGYYASPFPATIDACAVRLDGEPGGFLFAGQSVEVIWEQDAIGEVWWAELAIATCAPMHGDPLLTTVGWANVKADLETAATEPIRTSIALQRDIVPGTELRLVVAGQYGETRPGIKGANVTDRLGVGRIAVYTGSSVYRPSLLVGQPVTFTASKTACPIRASVLLP